MAAWTMSATGTSAGRLLMARVAAVGESARAGPGRKATPVQCRTTGLPKSTLSPANGGPKRNWFMPAGSANR
jgi:hypothetical protein